MTKKKYQIIVSFQTGDSFGSHDEQDEIELTWNDLSVAKENLIRIKEHYEWYELKRKSQRSWRKVEAPPRPKWISDDLYESIVPLKMDDGKIHDYHSFWCGYFEKLYGCKIELTNSDDDDMSFTLRTVF